MQPIPVASVRTASGRCRCPQHCDEVLQDLYGRPRILILGVMGTDTDAAIESAGVTLLGGDLTGIVRARRLSRATMGNTRQNLFFAFACNAAGVPVAAGVLYPFFGILLSPLIVAATMALSSVSVVGNALRLRAVTLG